MDPGSAAHRFTLRCIRGTQYQAALATNRAKNPFARRPKRRILTI
jgi:hypothetical protein